MSNVKTHLAKRPAGITAVAASVLVVIAAKFGVHVDQGAAASIVGALTVLVSVFSPRAIEVIEDVVDEIAGATE